MRLLVAFLSIPADNTATSDTTFKGLHESTFFNMFEYHLRLSTHHR